MHFLCVACSYKTRYPSMMLKVVCYSESEQGVAQAIIRGKIDFEREPWPSISESAKNLVSQMLEPDAKLRLTAKQVLGMLALCPLGYSFYQFLISTSLSIAGMDFMFFCRYCSFLVLYHICLVTFY